MEKKLDKLLKIEENKELYNYTFAFKNVMMYAVIRSYILEEACKILYGYSYEDAVIKSYFNKIIYLFKAYLYRIPKKIKSDILIFDTDLSNIKQENKYFNFVSEYYAYEYPDNTVIIEGSHKLNYSRPRTYLKVYSNDFLRFTAIIKSKFIKKNKNDLQNIDLFILFLKQLLNEKANIILSDKVWKKAELLLIRALYRIPFLYNSYYNLFKSLETKIILIKNGCRGGGNKIPIFMAAKDLNIPIGELNHGFPQYLPIYVFSHSLAESYKYFLPDFFLTTGKASLKMFSVPIPVFETGYPFLSENIKKYKTTEKKELLVYMSGRFEPELYIKEVLYLNKELSKYGCAVSFRVHPQEIERINTVYKPIIDAGIVIDSHKTKSLHETLSTAKYIVSGGASSVLLEALAFGCNVFIKNTPLNNEIMNGASFNIYNTKEEITDIIKNNKFIKFDTKDIITENWQEEYRKFIQDKI